MLVKESAEGGSDVMEAAWWIHCTFQFLIKKIERAHLSTLAVRLGPESLFMDIQ